MTNQLDLIFTRDDNSQFMLAGVTEPQANTYIELMTSRTEAWIQLQHTEFWMSSIKSIEIRTHGSRG